jgi:hypothetical protein
MQGTEDLVLSGAAEYKERRIFYSARPPNAERRILYFGARPHSALHGPQSCKIPKNIFGCTVLDV